MGSCGTLLLPPQLTPWLPPSLPLLSLSLDFSCSPTPAPGSPPPLRSGGHLLRSSLGRVLSEAAQPGAKAQQRQPQLQEAQQLVSNGARAGANPLFRPSCFQPNPLMALPSPPASSWHSPPPQYLNIHGSGTKGCPLDPPCHLFPRAATFLCWPPSFHWKVRHPHPCSALQNGLPSCLPGTDCILHSCS